ncbi:hypothetical protein N7G274_002775 [Stereocaulon virgatum]|uniref:Tubulin-specific chaperone A n=1 Tax=Stereocaulon virgatum TaxID=373712 RepID=A0ABR4AIK5_9LECA
MAPPPSQLSIATSSINRLLKEESSYRTELAGQRKRLEKLEAGRDGGGAVEGGGGGGGDDDDDDDEQQEEEEVVVGNREFEVRQEGRGVFSFVFFFLICSSGLMGFSFPAGKGGGVEGVLLLCLEGGVDGGSGGGSTTKRFYCADEG